MGIYDRDYARDDAADFYGDRRPSPGFRLPFRGSVTNWLIAINIVVFVLDIVLSRYVSVAVPRLVGVAPDGSPKVVPELMPPLAGWGHFSLSLAVMHAQVWRFLTYQFLHAGLMHILFNMLGLWSFGRLVEERMGSRRYLAFYILCGIAGASLYLLLSVGGMLYQHRVPFFLPGSPTDILVGASASIFGVLVAAAYYAPRSLVSMIFPPVTLELRVMVWIFIAIALLTVYADGNNSGGEAAHLGGAALGYLLVRHLNWLNWVDFRSSSPPRKPKPSLFDPPSPSAHDQSVDRILAKIATEGIQSLTEKEKRILQQDTAQKRKRA